VASSAMFVLETEQNVKPTHWREKFPPVGPSHLFIYLFFCALKSEFFKEEDPAFSQNEKKQKTISFPASLCCLLRQKLRVHLSYPVSVISPLLQRNE
jgi:hypothetical protein